MQVAQRSDTVGRSRRIAGNRCGVDANVCVVGDGGAPGGTGGNAKIWRTTDGGTSWVTVLTTGGTVGFWNGAACDPNNRNFIYAQSDAPTGTQWVSAISTNGGANWTTTLVTTTGGGIGNRCWFYVSGTTGANPMRKIYCVNNMIFGNGMSSVNRLSYTTNGASSWSSGLLSVAGTFTCGAAAGARFEKEAFFISFLEQSCSAQQVLRFQVFHVQQTAAVPGQPLV